MDGFRVTETGDFRITEAGDSRTTEQFFEAFASVVANGTLDSTAVIRYNGATSLSNIGSAIYIGVASRIGATRLNASSLISPTGNLKANVFSDLEAQGSSVVEPKLILNGLMDVQASSTLATIAGFKLSGEFTGTAETTLDTSIRYIAEALFGPNFDGVTRITEDGNTRITEDGDVRISVGYSPNAVYGSLVVNSDRIPFDAIAYTKFNGVWEEFTPYVNRDGVWTIPEKMYKNINGNWKRIY